MPDAVEDRGTALDPVGERCIVLDRPIDLRRTLAPLRHGQRDPCLRIDGSDVWRATRNADGPATLHLRLDAPSRSLRARAWGAGALLALAGVEDLIGLHDDDQSLVAMLDGAPAPSSDIIRALARRLPGVRIPRSGAITEALVPAILEQKVTGLEAKRSYRELVAAHGTPAPGPAAGRLQLRVPPAPEVLAALPGWAWHRFGVERKRADTIRMACSYSHRLEEVATETLTDARRRLRSLPGVGPWTAAEVALAALGDPDAVSIGDYHLPHQVAWALAGQPRGDDRVMLELLEPYRGQRARVIRLIAGAGIQAPRWGPRLEVHSARHR
jgi:3-methyladenine DNA glycosylase/8-oxoguanine DNA glycosylase